MQVFVCDRCGRASPCCSNQIHKPKGWETLRISRDYAHSISIILCPSCVENSKVKDWVKADYKETWAEQARELLFEVIEEALDAREP